jgi:hypothetical protein
MKSKASNLRTGRPSAKKSNAATLASLADEASTKRVNFDVETADHTRLKVYAARHGKTVRELLSEYVRSLPDS